MDDIGKLVPRPRPDECSPATCEHACMSPTAPCLNYRVEWSRMILRDFEEGFLSLSAKLDKIQKTRGDAKIYVDLMSHSVDNMLEMVSVVMMILRGDFQEADRSMGGGAAGFRDLGIKDPKDI
jgi:hypothetical protein